MRIVNKSVACYIDNLKPPYIGKTDKISDEQKNKIPTFSIKYVLVVVLVNRSVTKKKEKKHNDHR